MAKSRNKNNITRDINDLFNTTDATLFQQKLDEIIKKYNKLILQEKIREVYNKKVLTNTLNISQANDQILRNYLNQNDAIAEHNKRLTETLSLVTKVSDGIFSQLKWLDDIDGAIKKANLSMGITGGIALEVRDNIIEVSKYASRLGASVESITEMQVAYNNALGRSVIMNQENLKALITITKSLGLANDFAGEMAGNFETIGYNTSNTKDFIEDAIISANKMGVNVNKVLTAMNTSFNRANTFNFSKGISAFKEMVEYSQKFKINIDSAFNSMEMARTLEGSIEMASKLMVMGGEFSKQNPFELSFLARNRPEEYAQKINEMTKGIYFFNQETKQFQSSAYELDRLRAVAEATGIPFEELNQQAMRLAQVNLAKSKLIGFSEKDKEFISSIAEFDAKTGKFSVSINGNAVDIQKLNTETLETYKKVTKTLEDRAVDAMNFNESYNVMINEFKSLFLPFIKIMNNTLTVINSFSETTRMFIGGLALATPIIGSLAKLIPMFTGGVSNLKATIQSWFSKSPTGGAPVTPVTTTANPAGGKGFSLNLTGAATALATGAAFIMVAKGISMMADAYKELDVNKIDKLNISLGIIGATGIAAAFAIGKIGIASAGVAPGLLALGGTVALIGIGAMAMGKGIEFASNGISNLASNLANIEPSKMLGIGAGLGAISLGMASFINPMTMLGMLKFGAFLGMLSLAQKPLENLSTTFSEMNKLNANFTGINTVLDKVQAITSSKNSVVNDLITVVNELSDFVKKPTWINELKDILSKPLKVELNSKDFKIQNEIKVYLDSEEIYRKTLSRLPKDFDLIQRNRMNNSRLKTFYDQ